MPDLGSHLLSRRRFLMTAGAAAGAVALGACGGDDDSNAGETTTSKLVLAQYYGGPLFAAGQPLRAPFGLADSEGLLSVKDTPRIVEVIVLAPDGKQVGDPITLQRHAEGLERAYFPLELTLPDPGIYTVRAHLGGAAGSEMSLEVKDPADLAVIQPGAAMPALDTPTTADARGVDPICTADPVCKLHDVTVAQALADKKPLALLVATPAFCQVSICGPVLNILLDRIGRYPNVRAVHAEVYLHPHVNLTDYAPTVSALGMHLEPSLILVGSDGKVVDRLDAIYDSTELDQRLAQLT